MLALDKLIELIFMAFGADMFVRQPGQFGIVRGFMFIAMTIGTCHIFFGVLTRPPVGHKAGGNLLVAGDTLVLLSLYRAAKGKSRRPQEGNRNQYHSLCKQDFLLFLTLPFGRDYP